MNLSNLVAFIKQFRAEIIAVVISLWALYLRINLLAHSQIDGDALWQVGFLQKMTSFVDLLKHLPKADHAGYLAGDFILLYPFVKIFGWNKWALAFPHLVITFIGFYFLYLLAKEHFKTSWGYLVAFMVLAFNDNLIAHSVEIRAYAVMPTLALMALYFSLQLFKKNVTMSLKEKFLIGSIFVLTIWFHLYGVFIVFFSMLYVFLIHYRNIGWRLVLWDVVKFTICVLLIAMPLWFYSVLYGQDINVKNMSSARGMNTFDYISNPIVDPVHFIRAIFGNLMGFKVVDLGVLKINIQWLFSGVLFAFLLPHQERFKQIGFFLVLIMLPIQILFLADLSNQYWFLQRQFVWVMAWYALFLGWCWDSIIVTVSSWIKMKR